MAKGVKPNEGNYDFSIISEDHVLEAIQEIEKKDISLDTSLSRYQLIYNEKSYSPYLVLSWAYKNATGMEIGQDWFRRNNEITSLNFLEKQGFCIVPEKVQHRKEVNYSFLNSGFTITDKMLSSFWDVYRIPPKDKPVKIQIELEGCLYKAEYWYTRQSTGRGVSKIKYPPYGELSAHLKKLFPESAKQLDRLHGKPRSEQYPLLVVRKKEYVLIYFDPNSKHLILQKEMPEEIKHPPFDISRLTDITQTGLQFSDDLLKRYAVSLLTKPFVILSGLSGSGKTRLALAFAKWMAQDVERQVKIVPVGADWNSREYLLGYPNALTPGKYVCPENGVLDFVLEAAKEENQMMPFFLILDEMNLSYVERYFSDFLSAMESKEAVTLHPEGDEWEVPARVEFPKNLFLIGTINVDETTYMFSPKVLDRANVIEFRISSDEMERFLRECNPVEPDAVNGQGAPMGESFVSICKDKDLKYDKECREDLLAFFKALKPVGAEFGYRTADEMYRFIALAKLVKAGWKRDDLMDIVVMQKMLPKLHGSRKKMQPVLKALWKLCKATVKDKEKAKELLIEAEEMTFEEGFRYPLSAEKVWLMYRNAQDNGFTSYAEA